MSRKTSERRYIRSVISRVHPDLFEGHDEQQQVNTESLKALHAAVETLSTGKHVNPVDITFYQRQHDDSGNFERISLRLTDSLVPLYEAFGVISPEDAEEIRSQENSESRSIEDVNFLQWLESTIQEATVTAADLANQKELLAQLQSSATNEFNLACIKMGTQNTASSASVCEVLDHIESITVVQVLRQRLITQTDTVSLDSVSSHLVHLSQCLRGPLALSWASYNATPRVNHLGVIHQDALRADPEIAERVAGLTLRVHCPRHAPIRDYHWVDFESGEDFHISTRKWAEVGARGEIEVVAHRTGVAERLRSLDYARAHQLSAVGAFWKGRQDALARAVAQVLRVKFVWPDENCSETDFCMWAGRVLRDKLLISELADAEFSFTMLVHSDEQAPAASFLPSSSTVQVHHHCSPRQLMELLLSNAAIAASSTSGERLETATAEQELLSAAKVALGARHVVRICARDKGERVTTALQRLIENAPRIKQRIDLRGVCLAIDDNYHLWDSGYVSIPYDFDIDSMAGEVTKLLAPAADVPAESAPAAEMPGMTSEAEVAAAEAAEAAEAAAAAAAAAKAAESAASAAAANMARVHPVHQSAEEFIANLKDTMDAAPGGGGAGGGGGLSMDGAPVVDESLAAWIEGQVGDLGAGVSTFAAGAMAHSSRVDVEPGAGAHFGAQAEALAASGVPPGGVTVSHSSGGEIDVVVPEIPDHVRAAAAADGERASRAPSGLPVIPSPYAAPAEGPQAGEFAAGPMSKLADAVRLVKSRSGGLQRRRRSDGGDRRRSPSPVAAHGTWPSVALPAEPCYDSEDLPCGVDMPIGGGDSTVSPESPGAAVGGTGGPGETPHDRLKARKELARGVAAASLPARKPCMLSPVRPPGRGAAPSLGSPTKLQVRAPVPPRSRRAGGLCTKSPQNTSRRGSFGGGMLL